MAEMGHIAVNVTSRLQLGFRWTLINKSISNYTSTVEWAMWLSAGEDGGISTSDLYPWSATVNGVEYGGKTLISVASNNNKTLVVGTTTIPHDADGTKTFDFSFALTFNAYVGGKFVETIEGNGEGVLDALPRSSGFGSVADGTLGVSQTIGVVKYDSSLSHTITYTCGTASGTICTKSTAKSVKFTPPLDLAWQGVNSERVQVTLTMQTYSGDEALPNKKNISFWAQSF